MEEEGWSYGWEARREGALSSEVNNLPWVKRGCTYLAARKRLKGRPEAAAGVQEGIGWWLPLIIAATGET
jgi:hypothetical protein